MNSRTIERIGKTFDGNFVGHWLIRWHGGWKIMRNLFAARRYLVNQGIVRSVSEIQVTATPGDFSRGW